MQNRNKNFLLLLLLPISLMASSFSVRGGKDPEHGTVTRTIAKNNEGQEVIKTQVVLDGTTSREALIAACALLRKDQVQLTFKQVIIRKSFLGLLGKSRLAYARGRLQLPDGIREEFEAGGAFNFRYIKLTYTRVRQTGQYTLNMIEIVD